MPPASLPPTDVERLEQLREVLTKFAEAALGAAQALGLPPKPLLVSTSHGGVILQLALVPEGKRHFPQLGECARDILVILAGAQSRMTTTRIIQELERRGLIHGTSTVARVLANLSHSGLISSSRKSPQGYSLEAQPASSSTLCFQVAEDHPGKMA